MKQPFVEQLASFFFAVLFKAHVFSWNCLANLLVLLLLMVLNLDSIMSSAHTPLTFTCRFSTYFIFLPGYTTYFPGEKKLPAILLLFTPDSRKIYKRQKRGMQIKCGYLIFVEKNRKYFPRNCINKSKIMLMLVLSPAWANVSANTNRYHCITIII